MLNTVPDSRAGWYEIVIQGQLDPRHQESFAGMTLTWLPDGDTLLAGHLVDQAALHGVLNRIRDLGIPLLGVRQGAWHRFASGSGSSAVG